jgi:hypothetical protein
MAQFPGRIGLGFPSAEIANGRRGIRNPFEDGGRALKISAQTATGKMHNGFGLGSSRKAPNAGQQERQDEDG